MNSRKLIGVALALAGALTTGLAQARGHDDVQWSVTIGAPMGVPVYEQRHPVYIQPVPAFVQPRHGHQRHDDRRHDYQRPTRWDRDGDGVPNRFDRVFNPRWDRDGDGVPNRFDRYDNLRHDRDADGIPNWRDRHDGGYGRHGGR